VYDRLSGAIDRLPEHQKTAIVLSYHEELSNAEIAEIMDTTVSSVESLLKRGRQRLRDILKRAEGDVRGSFE